MKRERLSILVLAIEIAAIVYLHSIKTRQSGTGNNVAHGGNHAGTATYQLKALPVTRLK